MGKPRLVLCCLASTLVAIAGAVAPARGDVPHKGMRVAIQGGKEYLIEAQRADGTWVDLPDETNDEPQDRTEMVLQVLGLMGMHPNQPCVASGLERLCERRPASLERAASRLFAMTHYEVKLLPPERGELRDVMSRHVEWLTEGQRPDGGWSDRSANRGEGSSDVGSTCLVLRALREAGRWAVDVPELALRHGLAFLSGSQREDGSWGRDGTADGPGSVKATAAAVDALLRTLDVLNEGRALDADGRPPAKTQGVYRRVHRALAWLDESWHPEARATADRSLAEVAAEYRAISRAALAAGRKYVAGRDWERKQALDLIASQGSDGSWADADDRVEATCQALGVLWDSSRATPFQKLRFEGEWNRRPRDLANHTRFVGRMRCCEGLVRWQIVDAGASVRKLHHAPVLFISAASVPNLGLPVRKRLREFTDTGGTILVETEEGRADVRAWVREFAETVWPEWGLSRLDEDHAVLTDPWPLNRAPELYGIDDGIRTFLFCSPGGLSRAWHARALAREQACFRLGMNIWAYAGRERSLRWMLGGEARQERDRYPEALNAGKRRDIRLARVRHSGDWDVGRHYKGFARLAEHLAEEVGVRLQVAERGVEPGNFSGYDIAFLTGTKAVNFTEAEAAALKRFTDGGGFLWMEAAAGNRDFDATVRQVAEQAGWTMKLLPHGHALMGGRIGSAHGYDLSSDVRFRRAIRFKRMRRPYAELHGLVAGGRLVGVYSPLDIMFSITPYHAHECRGYRSQDAVAVATNLVLYATARSAGFAMRDPNEAGGGVRTGNCGETSRRDRAKRLRAGRG